MYGEHDGAYSGAVAGASGCNLEVVSRNGRKKKSTYDNQYPTMRRKGSRGQHYYRSEILEYRGETQLMVRGYPETEINEIP